MGARLLAVIAEGVRGKVFLSPSDEIERVALEARAQWKPELSLAPDPRALWTPPYGLTEFGHLFTSRQLLALTTFADLVAEARDAVLRGARTAISSHDKTGFQDGASDAAAYADAIATYLGLGVGRSANYWSSLNAWGKDFIVQTFGRQAIPMMWDYAEGNPFSDSTGNWSGAIDWIKRVIENALPASSLGSCVQADAQSQSISQDCVVSTDPPYYDNIGYADLSDYFYVWLRRALRDVHPELFTTLGVPKTEELVAIPYRHGSASKAEAFFLDGMTKAMSRIGLQAHPAFPITIYYAFKQSESENEAGTASTGWETFLQAVIHAGLSVTGTWPVRTERDQGLKTGTNVLASSIILVCRPRVASAPIATRREFITALKAELPLALAHLQRGNIAPVDLAQAAIGPGMAVYTRYTKVLDADGKSLSVREALALINQTLDEALAEQEGDFDADSRWALAWFEQHGFEEGSAGEAILLSTAKATALNGLEEAGIIESGRGKVRLYTPHELPSGWDPSTDLRLTAWEVVHHLIRVLDSSQGGGEPAAAVLLSKLGAKAEPARELCYRLYTMCERKKRAADALAYNGLVQSWPEIVRLAAQGPAPSRQSKPSRLIDEDEE